MSRRILVTSALPYANGQIHLGHMLEHTEIDVTIRWHRMLGDNTLWLPGTDHAGIATQMVVARKLAEEGINYRDLGRDEFEKRVWEWKAQSGDTIKKQMVRLGASCDWSRERFTLDPKLADAVTEHFVRLYEEGLIYRGERLINWDPVDQTAVSDLEVEYKKDKGGQTLKEKGELFKFAYRLADGSGEIVVATTRPETMLGDTAVAVHPDDPRYKHLHGKMLKHPFVDRLVPIITDAILVDPKFGTGAVKVTPAHDWNDFETGKRHNLESITIFNLDGTMNDLTGQFVGLDRKRARTAVKKALDEKGLAKGSKPHTLNIPRCSRSGDPVERVLHLGRRRRVEQPGREGREVDDVRFPGVPDASGDRLGGLERDLQRPGLRTRVPHQDQDAHDRAPCPAPRS